MSRFHEFFPFSIWKFTIILAFCFLLGLAHFNCVSNGPIRWRWKHVKNPSFSIHISLINRLAQIQNPRWTPTTLINSSMTTRNCSDMARWKKPFWPSLWSSSRTVSMPSTNRPIVNALRSISQSKKKTQLIPPLSIPSKYAIMVFSKATLPEQRCWIQSSILGSLLYSSLSYFCHSLQFYWKIWCGSEGNPTVLDVHCPSPKTPYHHYPSWGSLHPQNSCMVCSTHASSSRSPLTLTSRSIPQPFNSSPRSLVYRVWPSPTHSF